MILVDKFAVIGALAQEYASIDALLASLRDGEWLAQTPCPGWDVRAQIAHIVGTELQLGGVEPPSAADDQRAAHIRNDVGAANERWIAELGTLPPDELLEQFRSATGATLDRLRAMPETDWNAEGFTPAGRDSYGRYVRIRVFDCWVHEQDIRDATGHPGHASGAVVEFVLDEAFTGIGFVIGKQAKAPRGSAVTIELAGNRTVHVEVADRAGIVSALDHPADTTLRMPVGIYTRLSAGRISSIDEVEISGDQTLGRTIAENLAFTI